MKERTLAAIRTARTCEAEFFSAFSEILEDMGKAKSAHLRENRADFSHLLH